jgi:NitT/TauT family transport system substrate-binding protein
MTTSRRDLLGLLGGFAVAACSKPSDPVATADADTDRSLRVGYLPITDAAPLLVAHGRGFFAAEGLEVARPTLLRSWPQVAEAFQAGKLDLVHLLMPMTIWLRFGQSFPLKVVGWDHVDGSALTVSPRIAKIDDLAGETVAVPFWYSVHNVVLQQLLKRSGLQPILKGEASRGGRTVKIVVMAPPDMPPALASGSIAGFIVADPFNALAEMNGVGNVLRFTGDVWQRHACCVLTMHEADVTSRPQWVQSAVTAVAKAQRYLRENRADAATLLSKDGQGYLPQARDVIERALADHEATDHAASGAVQHADWRSARIDFEPFPFPSYTEKLVTLLKDTLVEGDTRFLTDLDPKRVHAALVDDRFARVAIAAAGGAAAFGVDPTLERREVFDP